MNKKIMAIAVVAIMVVAGASILFVVLDSNRDEGPTGTVTFGMVLSSGGEHFGLQDMGTYYFHGANVYHENLVATDENGNYYGLLAESWTTNSDASVWTFVIRDNVKWSDGIDFSADDVLFTINYILDKKPWGMNDAAFLNNLESATKGMNSEGKETVTMTMDGPFANLLLNMRCGMTILPEHIYKNVDDPMSYGDPVTELNAAIGTGPFIVDKLDVSSRTMTLHANQNYYNGVPKTEIMRIRYYSDWNTMVLALANGECDASLAWGSGVSATILPEVEKYDNLKTGEYSSAAISAICFNTLREPYDNADLRVAFSYCVDYEKFVDNINSGVGSVPGKTLVPSCMKYYVDEGLLEYNIDKAKAAFDRLGYTDTDGDGYRETPSGGDFQPTLAFSASSADRARLIQTGCRLAGIDLQLDSISSGWGSWKRQVDGNGIRLYDMVLSGCSFLGTNSWMGYGTTFVDINGGLKDCQVNDEEFQDIITELKSANTDAKMKSAVEDLQDYYMEEVPFIPLFENEIVTIQNAGLTGLTVDPLFGYTICCGTLMNVCWA
ncbi:MAG: ABC transporter substrate-binding protein [Candidatus Methanomethylophilaceae archaeon]